ncbi:MAG TPA: glycosyltransferase family 39 protein, partial [Gammaproteobacteria bacterium]|nr:glycosyltransferase family 39 protein [Gammaproteobacteria bacterium]
MTKLTQGLNQKTPWLWDLAFIAGFLAIFYFLGLNSYPLFTPDEGRYSEVAREMIVTGDFITPRLNGVVFLDKPILYYWLQASAIKIFGLKEGALRFWPALFGIWGCLCLYIAGRILFNRRTALLSTLLLSTSVLYFGAAHYANLDLEVAVLVSTTLLFFLLGLKSPQPQASRLWIYGAYFFSGLAILTKGLIGLAFPIIIIGSWTLLLGKWENIKKLRPFTGLGLVLTIVLPWYLLAQKANPAFFHFFFVVQQISRFLSTQDFNNQVAWWFYFPIVLAGFLPWTLFIFSSLLNILGPIWR